MQEGSSHSTEALQRREGRQRENSKVSFVRRNNESSVRAKEKNVRIVRTKGPGVKESTNFFDED